jgi:hypothetical protein
MIIGRTEENDIVVNHRSISRNHAKLVREPDTGRYTISDLQSSNGVRVNGQDYGKVELRRGDVVDLGHVRLRFIEPGEDFVFSRDAVITDVPDVGGKRNMLMFAIIGLLLIVGGVVAVVMATGGKKTEGTGPKTDLNTVAKEDATPAVAEAPDAEPQVVKAEIDAGKAAVENPNPPVNEAEKQKTLARCRELGDKRTWADLITCSEQLQPFDAVMAKRLRDLATGEIKAEARSRGVENAVDQGDLKQAKVDLDQIPANSVYRKAAEDKLEAAINTILPTLTNQVNSNKDKDDKCTAYNAALRRIDEKYGKGVERLVRGRTNCTPKVIAKPPCNADELKDSAQQAFTSGAFGQALKGFEDSYACRSQADTAMRAFITACNLKKVGPAKRWFNVLPGNMQTQTKVICIRNGISEDQLKGP